MITDEQYERDERAAIMEHDGGFTRKQAEMMADAEMEAKKRQGGDKVKRQDGRTHKRL